MRGFDDGWGANCNRAMLLSDVTVLPSLLKISAWSRVGSSVCAAFEQAAGATGLELEIAVVGTSGGLGDCPGGLRPGLGFPLLVFPNRSKEG